MLNKITAGSVELNWEVQHAYPCELIWVDSRKYKQWLCKFLMLNFKEQSTVNQSCFINAITKKQTYDRSIEND